MPDDAPTAAPYGSWPSPVSPAMIATGQVRVSETTAQGDATYWLESRPSDGGRVPHTSFDVPYLHAVGNRLVFVAVGRPSPKASSPSTETAAASRRCARR